MAAVANADLIGAAIGFAAGAGGATVKYALAQRARIHDDLWGRRLEVYREVWTLTSQFSRWPRQHPGLEDVRELHEQLRRWYYRDGGILLSTRARERYEYVQKALEAISLGDEHGAVRDTDYGDVMTIMSRFRSALTDDLESRRKRSIVWSVLAVRSNRQVRRELDGRLGGMTKRTRGA